MAMTERSVVVGIFQDRTLAEQAIRELQRAGFSNDQIKYSVNKGGPGILDGLMGMDIPYNEASYYNDEFQAGRTIVSVRAGDRQKQAYDLLRLSGANIRLGNGVTADNSIYAGTGSDQRMQLHEEILQVEKQWVQTSEIRIRKRVITEEKVFKVPVKREEVIIERIPFNSQSTSEAVDDSASIETNQGKSLTLKDGETFKILVREEQVTFEKKPIVVEEITLTKRVLQETKHIADTVRREEVRIERKGNVHIQGDNSGDPSIQSYQQE